MKSACIAGAAALLSTLAACNFERTRPAMGAASSVIVAVPDSLWDVIGDSVLAALEPRIFTVRDEKAFELTQVSPLEQEWRNLRRFRQVLAIGTPEDGWVQRVLGGHDPPGQLPAVIERREVWVRNQLVTAIVIPVGGGAEDVYSVLGAVADTMDRRYRAYARQRMFVSGADAALRDSLARSSGFSLLLPEVYRYERIDSGYVFRNHSEMSGVLQRTIVVTWRSGPAAQIGTPQILAWRDSIGDVVYSPGHDIDETRFETRRLDAGTGAAFQVQGVWTSRDTSWPAAGPFISRMIECPEQDRTYLLDAWLYAPGKQKYEYMIQLDTILESFRCGHEALTPGRSAAT